MSAFMPPVSAATSRHPRARAVRTPRATRLQRALAAALCLPLLLSACSATAQGPATTVAWPEPRPAEATVAQAPRMVPNFQAPSAEHCARPIQTREVPGRSVQEQAAADAERSRREERSSAFAGRLGGGALPEAPAASAIAPAPAPAAAPMARADLAAESGRAAKSAAPARNVAPGSPAPAQPQRALAQTVTAGMVDDNAGFAEYLAFRQRTQVPHRARDVAERYLLEVKDAWGRAVPDAELAVQSPQGAAMWARTDAGGRAWLHPDAFDPSRSRAYQVVARKGGSQATATFVRGQKSAVELRLGSSAEPAARARLDLVFLIDATGSMADEIDKLKATLQGIAADVAALPSQPDLCLGLVAYRDKGDAFLLRSHDFTNDLAAFQNVLNQLRAGGGGDYPEAMNEALHETVHRLSWRGNGTTRLVVLLADAPPHLDYGGPQYDDDMAAALGKGIKVFGVGASGLDKQGEYIQRQIAQYTGGRFVFLTYADARHPASGPGRETAHDVSNYSVDTLDRLVVRLVRDELAQLPQPGASVASRQ